MEFLETKDVVPAIRGPIVESPRRLKALGVSLERPVTLIFAPPGYGKTTLCASYCASLPAGKFKVIWLNLDEADRDTSMFMFDLVSAVHRALPELGLWDLLEQRFDELNEKQTSYEFLIAFANTLSRSKKRPYIVLDNFDMISAESAAHIRFLAHSVASNVSMVFIASSPVGEELGDLMISGDLGVINTPDLTMTREEMEFFLEENCDIQFNEEQMDALCDLACGCVASLRIVANCFQEGGNANGGFEDALERSRSRLQSYTLNRLLRMFDEQTVRFLMKVSFAPRFTIGLCNAVGIDWLRHDALDALKTSGVLKELKTGFGGWYAISKDYKDTIIALRDQYLSRDERDAVCNALITWYEDEEMFEEALDLMIVQKNDGRFISLFTRNMEAILQRNDGSRILEWLGGMSETAATSNLATLLASAWGSFTAGQPEESIGWLRYVFAGNNYEGIKNREDNPDYYDLWSLIKTIEACATSQMGNYSEGIRMSMAALDRLGSEKDVLADRTNLWLWVTLWHNLGECYMMTGDIRKSYEALSASRMDSIVARRPTLYHFCSYEMGMLRMYGGNLKAAERLFKETIRSGKSTMPIPETWALGLVYAGRAHLRMLQGSLSEARDDFAEACELVERSANVDGYLECMMLRCRLEHVKGDIGHARAAIDEAYKDALSVCVPRGVAEEVLAQKALMDTLAGDFGSAQNILDELAEIIHPDNLMQQSLYKGTLAYLHAMRKKTDSALVLVNEAIECAKVSDRQIYVAELSTLKAGLLWDSGDKDGAVREALDALLALYRMNAPVIWKVYDGYPLIRAVLEKLVHSSDPTLSLRGYGDEDLYQFAQKCLDYVGGGSPSASRGFKVTEALTPKELAVCELVMKDKTRKEIADAMGVSMNTVKTHVKAVYRKLGVHSNKEFKEVWGRHDGFALSQSKQ